jgi:pimeloyl-ACP methyl ester carboxylesterase
MKQFFTFPLFLFFILLAGCSGRNSSAPREKPVIKNNDVLIDYTDVGDGDTTLFFVHGWGINKTYWDGQVDHFRNRYRVIAMDLPGFGQSGKNRDTWTTAAFGGDVSAVIDQLKLKKVILVGHSMAGNIIVQATNNNPRDVIGMIGVDNFQGIGWAQHQTKEDSLQYRRVLDSLRHHFKAVATEWFNKELFYVTTPDSIRQRVLADVAKVDSVVAVDCMEPDGFDDIKALQQTKKKLCLVNSDVKPTDTAAFTQNHIPYEIWYIHATGHYPMIEKTEDFNELLEQAIKRTSP